MEYISMYEIEYMNYYLIIKNIGTKEIDENSISILNISIKKQNSICNLGDFYIPYKESLSDEDINYIAKNIIENVDEIIFENNRCIGIEIENNFNDENIKDIYSEFLEMDENSIDYKRYSRFLDLYFNSHFIPDSIRKMYLDKANTSILDYDDLDSEIRKCFITSMEDLISEDEQIELQNSLDSLNISIIDKEKELLCIKEIIDKIENILNIKNENHRIKESIVCLEKKLNELSFFEKGRKEIKLSIKNLENQIIPMNISDERRKIKECFDKYASLYNDARGLKVLFDSLTLGDILCILCDIYHAKTDIYNNLVSRKDELVKKIDDYAGSSIDISDLYERLDKTKVKE